LAAGLRRPGIGSNPSTLPSCKTNRGSEGRRRGGARRSAPPAGVNASSRGCGANNDRPHIGTMPRHRRAGMDRDPRGATRPTSEICSGGNEIPVGVLLMDKSPAREKRVAASVGKRETRIGTMMLRIVGGGGNIGLGGGPFSGSAGRGKTGQKRPACQQSNFSRARFTLFGNAHGQERASTSRRRHGARELGIVAKRVPALFPESIKDLKPGWQY